MDLFSVVILQCTSVTEHRIAHCLLACLSEYDICCEPMQWESKGGIVSSPVPYLKRPAHEIIDRQSGGHMQSSDNTDPATK